MDCRDVRELADSFLSEELLTETNHEILRHLDACPKCCGEIAARRRLRASIRGAFERAPDLQPRVDFAAGLRDRLRGSALARQPRRKYAPGGLWALAATLVLASGLVGAVWVRGRIRAELTRLAVGDHRDCAMKFRLSEKPIALEQAARRFDAAYRALETFPPDEISTPLGVGRVLERHACVYAGRRFAHLVIDYRGTRVSLLVTSSGSNSVARRLAFGPPSSERLGSLSIVSISTAQHAIFLVGALDPAELSGLADALRMPLVQKLTGA